VSRNVNWNLPATDKFIMSTFPASAHGLRIINAKARSDNDAMPVRLCCVLPQQTECRPELCSGEMMLAPVYKTGRHSKRRRRFTKPADKANADKTNADAGL
jgi:hypothetical protein